jgi:K+-transporting ATPase A subunit
MSLGLWQLLAFVVLLTLITKPLGSYMADVFEGRRTPLSRVLVPFEGLIYRSCGIDPERQQQWTAYAGSCLAFSLVGALLFYAHLRLQGILPLNPRGFGTPSAPPGATPMTPDLAFNIAISFMTNTSWQAWPGETMLSYLSQMLGIAVQSFTSAASGMAVAIALIRSLARQESDLMGNFWVDITKSVLYILLPLSSIGALFLCSQGVVQSLSLWQKAATLEGAAQFAVMMFLFIAGSCITMRSEQCGSPAVNAASAGGRGNMEGKEVRFGAPASSVFSVVSTASSDSAVASLNANTPWFNLTLGLEMLIGRFLVLLPALAIAGSLVRKKRLTPVTIGTVPGHGFMSGALLVGTIVIVTALTFLPTLSLAPIAEHYLMRSGVSFP